MGEVQYGCSWGGGGPTLVTVVGEVEPLDAGTWIVCPMMSSESAERPLSAASVSGERPYALAIDDRLSPGVTVWEASEPTEVDGAADAAPAEASAVAPSASVGYLDRLPRVDLGVDRTAR